MPKKEAPRFIIYQVNEKEFHICFEAKGKFLRWCSYYFPSMDIRFPREVNKIRDIPVGKQPAKKIVDQGTYTTNKKDNKVTAEEKFLNGVEKKTFAVILDGKKLKGRFAFKKYRGASVIQKYKDKYAVEEDVFAGDLLRTINTMVPDYDESKVKLENPRKKVSKRKTETEEPDEVEEEITPDKTIGNTEYHFAFYTSIEEPDICLVTNDSGEVLIFEKQNKKWILKASPKRTVLKHQNEFVEHIHALSKQ